jgi:cyanate permease
MSDSITESRRWIILALIWLIYFSLMLNMWSLAPLMPEVAVDITLSLSQRGAILGTVMLIYIPMSLPTGIIVDKLGLRKSLILGTILIAISGLLRSYSFSYYSLFTTVAILGLGGPLVSNSAPKMVVSWFDSKERGTATGIYMTGPAIGNAVAMMISSTYMLDYAGTWRNVLRIYSIFAIGVAILWFLLGEEKSRQKSMDTTFGDALKISSQLLREKQIQYTLGIWIGVFIVGYGLGNWLPIVLTSRNITEMEVGVLSSIPSWIGIVGNLVIPRFSSKGVRKRLLTATLVGQLISIYLIGSSVGEILTASLILYGFFYGPLASLTMVLLMEHPEVDSSWISTASGLFFSIGPLGGFFGPYLIGYLWEITENVMSGVWLLIAVTMLMIIITQLLSENG